MPMVSKKTHCPFLDPGYPHANRGVIPSLSPAYSQPKRWMKKRNPSPIKSKKKVHSTAGGSILNLRGWKIEKVKNLTSLFCRWTISNSFSLFDFGMSTNKAPKFAGRQRSKEA